MHNSLAYKKVRQQPPLKYLLEQPPTNLSRLKSGIVGIAKSVIGYFRKVPNSSANADKDHSQASWGSGKSSYDDREKLRGNKKQIIRRKKEEKEKEAMHTKLIKYADISSDEEQQPNDIEQKLQNKEQTNLLDGNRMVNQQNYNSQRNKRDFQTNDPQKITLNRKSVARFHMEQQNNVSNVNQSKNGQNQKLGRFFNNVEPENDNQIKTKKKVDQYQYGLLHQQNIRKKQNSKQEDDLKYSDSSEYKSSQLNLNVASDSQQYDNYQQSNNIKNPLKRNNPIGKLQLNEQITNSALKKVKLTNEQYRYFEDIRSLNKIKQQIHYQMVDKLPQIRKEFGSFMDKIGTQQIKSGTLQDNFINKNVKVLENRMHSFMKKNTQSRLEKQRQNYQPIKFKQQKKKLNLDLQKILKVIKDIPQAPKPQISIEPLAQVPKPALSIFGQKPSQNLQSKLSQVKTPSQQAKPFYFSSSLLGQSNQSQPSNSLFGSGFSLGKSDAISKIDNPLDKKVDQKPFQSNSLFGNNIFGKINQKKFQQKINLFGKQKQISKQDEKQQISPLKNSQLGSKPAQLLENKQQQPKPTISLLPVLASDNKKQAQQPQAQPRSQQQKSTKQQVSNVETKKTEQKAIVENPFLKKSQGGQKNILDDIIKNYKGNQKFSVQNSKFGFNFAQPSTNTASIAPLTGSLFQQTGSQLIKTQSQKNEQQNAQFSTPTKNILQKYPNAQSLGQGVQPVQQQQQQQPSMADESQQSHSRRQGYEPSSHQSHSYQHQHYVLNQSSSPAAMMPQNSGNNIFGMAQSTIQDSPSSFNWLPDVDKKKSLEMFGTSNNSNSLWGATEDNNANKIKKTSRSRKQNKNQQRIYS